MKGRNQIVAMGIGIACILGGWLLFGTIGLPGPRSSGEPADADYCNVLLVPSIAEKIGLDLPMRIRVAKKGAGLLAHIRNGSGHNPVMVTAGKFADKIGSDLVARAGKEAREMLPAEAREKFEDLYSDGEFVRVRFWTEKAENGSLGGDRFFITYGWFEEEKGRDKLKSLRTLEDSLEDCHLWIPSAEVADRLLEDEDEDVRDAAEEWWRKRERRLEAEQVREERAREREDFRSHVEAMQEEVRARIRAARGEG